MRLLAIVALGCATVLAAAQEAALQLPTEEQLAAETRVGLLFSVAQAAYGQQDFERMDAALERALELRPQLAPLRFMLARAYALQDRKSEAYNQLVLLQRQGLSFDMEGDPDFENLRGYELYDYLVQEFQRNAEPYGRAQPAFSIPRTDLLVESLSWDPGREAFIAGSVTEGLVFTIDGRGRMADLAAPSEANGLLGVADLEVDAERGKLWVASGATPHVRHARLADGGVTALHRFDLDSGRHEATFPAPSKPAYFIDLDLAPDGSVFVADSLQPVIWRLGPEARPGEDAPEPFIANRTLTGIRAITLDDTGEHLYLADYERGLFGVSVADKTPFALDLGQDVNLSGIDALEWYRDSLLLVQNAVVPHRVLRLQLSADRRQARHAQPLLSEHPDFRNPVAMALAGKQLYLIANSHRNDYDPRSGEPLAAAELRPHQVLVLDPDQNWRPPED